MRERAKGILINLKNKNSDLKESFDAYVKSLSESLEIPERIAVNLVTDELVMQYEKQLILSELFSKYTLEDMKKTKD